MVPCRLPLLLALLAALAAGQSGPGYAVQSSVLAPPQVFVGGLDAAPDGSLYVFDGSALVRLAGSQRFKVWSPPSALFGSFVKVMPNRQAVLFGESSTGTITEISVGVLPYFRTVATVPYNFDAAFGPLAEILVSAPSATPGFNAVYLIDSQGRADALLKVAGASGPVAVLPGGDLLVGAVSDKWPQPAGAARLLRFPLAKWRGAVGPGELAEQDAAVVLAGLDNVAGLALDGTGRIYFADNYNLAVWAVGPAGPELVADTAPETPYFLAWTPGPGPGWLRPYQPAGGGTLYATANLWQQSNSLLAITAARPTLGHGFAGPVPPQTWIPLALAGGPPNGVAALFFARGSLSPEAVWTLPGLDFPLFLGLDPLTLAAGVFLSLDPAGQAKLPLWWPGGASATVHLQALVLDLQGLKGSSQPAAVMLGP